MTALLGALFSLYLLYLLWEAHTKAYSSSKKEFIM